MDTLFFDVPYLQRRLMADFRPTYGYPMAVSIEDAHAIAVGRRWYGVVDKECQRKE